MRATLGNRDTVSCTSLTHGLLEQNNLLLQLVLRDHYSIISRLPMCSARFIPSRLHCDGSVSFNAGRLGSRSHERSALSLTVADGEPPTEPVIADIILMFNHRPGGVQVPFQLVWLLLVAFSGAFHLLELPLQLLDLVVLTSILFLLPSA